MNRSTLFATLISVSLVPSCINDPASLTPCREGTALADDGHCYREDSLSVYDALLTLPDCEPVSLEGNIDFQNGCVGTGCTGMTFDQLNSAFNEYAPCTTADAETVECQWSLGISAGFSDEDDNLVPDSGTTTSWLLLYDAATGASLRGTGVGANTRCAIDELGPPNYTSLYIDNDTTIVRYLAYDTVGAYFYDLTNPEGASISDGIIDEIYLTGP